MSQEMEFFQELKQRLLEAQSGDASIRTAAEQDVRRMRDENVTKMLASLVKEISDEGNEENVRQMACLVLKNLISRNQVDPRYIDLWVKLEPLFKQQVKEAILSSLASQSPKIRNQIASLIAALAQIEIPRGEWTELIANLCTNASHESEQVKLTSLTTIGYICEELSPEDLTQELKNQIMLALTNNISKDEANVEACRLAIKALLFSIPYTTANFQVAEERDFIMSKILDEAMASSNLVIRETAMQCLVEIGRQEYQAMGTYIERMCQLTSQVAKHDASEVGSQGIEFWTTIAEVEISRREKQGQILNFIATYKDFLISLLLECISQVEIEDEDDAEEEWGVNLASGCCLVKLSALLRNDVLPPVIAFVMANIQHADWKKRYAALMALGAVSDGPEKPAFAQILSPSIPQLMNMFQDTSIKVREAIAWVTLQICTNHADVLASNAEQTAGIIQVMINSLPDKPKVSVYLCQAIEKLAESLAPYSPDQQENQLTPHFEKIAEALFKNASRIGEDEGSTNGLVQASYTTLTCLCQSSCTNSDASLQSMLNMILQQLQMTVEPNQASAKIMEVQFVLCGLVQVIMVRVGANVDTPTAESIVALIIKSFQQHQRVTEAGLIAYQGIVNGLKERVPFREFGQYIFNALEQPEDEDVTRVAIGLVIDIADGLRESVAQYLSSLVPHMLNVLKNDKRKQDTKLAAIQALASVSCYAAQSFCQHYLVDFMNLLQQAAEVSVREAEFQNDPDMLDYLKELRASLIEAYSQITLGVADSNTHAQFAPYIPQIFEFLYQATFQERTLQNFRIVAGLLGDLAGCMKGQIAQHFQATWVKEMLDHLKTIPNDNESKETAMWAWDQIQKAIQEGSNQGVIGQQPMAFNNNAM